MKMFYDYFYKAGFFKKWELYEFLHKGSTRGISVPFFEWYDTTLEANLSKTKNSSKGDFIHSECIRSISVVIRGKVPSACIPHILRSACAIAHSNQRSLHGTEDWSKIHCSIEKIVSTNLADASSEFFSSSLK